MCHKWEIYCLIACAALVSRTAVVGFSAIACVCRPHRTWPTQLCLSYDPTEQSDYVDEDEEAFYEEDYDEDELSDEDMEATMGEWDDNIARFNTVHLTGRIGTDPEARYLDDGKVVVNVNLATERKYHNSERMAYDIASGTEETDWYGLEIWGQTAEFVAKYVDKGSRVGVVGMLQVDEWQDRETGEPRNKAKVIVRDLDVLETRAEAEARRTNRRGPAFYRNEYDDDNDGGPASAGTGGFFDR